MRSLRSVLLFAFLLGAIESPAFDKASEFENAESPLKALVFLSSYCPCSKSHVDHLNQLLKQNSDLKLFGVATDFIDEGNRKTITNYYKGEGFEFPVIEDVNQSLTKRFKALKTPHVVLLKKQENGEYKTIYEGGVTDQRQFDQSKHRFLQENLEALKEGRDLPYEVGRSLGCYIRRF